MRRSHLNSTALLTSTKYIPGYIFGEQIYKRALKGNRKIAYIPIGVAPWDGDEIKPQAGSFERFRRFYRDQYHGADIRPFYFTGRMSGKEIGLLEAMINHYELVIFAGNNLSLALRRLRGVSAAFYHNPRKLERLLEDRGTHGLLTVGDGETAGILCNNAAGIASNFLVVTNYNLSPGKRNELRRLARSNPLSMCIGLPSNSSLEFTRGQFPHGTAYQFIEVSIDQSANIPSDPANIPTQRGLQPVICYKDGVTEWQLYGGDTIGRAILPPSKKEVGWGNLRRRFWHFRSWVESPRSGAIFNLFTRKAMRGTQTDEGYLQVNSLEDILVKKYFAINTRSKNW